MKSNIFFNFLVWLVWLSTDNKNYKDHIRAYAPLYECYVINV